MKAAWALAVTSTLLAATACSSGSGPSQEAIQKEQSSFCSLLTAWIQQNQNIGTAPPDTQADMKLADQLFTSGTQLTKWDATYGDGIKPDDAVVSMTQWAPGYQHAVDELRRYCIESGFQVPQWGQA